MKRQPGMKLIGLREKNKAKARNVEKTNFRKINNQTDKDKVKGKK